MSTDSEVLQTLVDRADAKCELCAADDDLQPFAVSPRTTSDADGCVLVCSTCAGELVRTDLDEKHWFCLQSAAWSAVPAVQALSLRLLARLSAAGWAADLKDQLYVDDEVKAWAESAGGAAAGDDETPTTDSNGTALAEGDSVTLIKDLEVKGAGFTAKRGTMVRNIRLTGDPEHVEGKVNGTMIVLKTKFLKKA